MAKTDKILNDIASDIRITCEGFVGKKLHKPETPEEIAKKIQSCLEHHIPSDMSVDVFPTDKKDIFNISVGIPTYRYILEVPKEDEDGQR